MPRQAAPKTSIHKSFKRAKIINAGTGGYTSQENLIDLSIDGFAYEPDMVVAYLPVNDIYQAAHWPGFRRDYTHVRIPLEIYTVSGSEPPKQHIHSYPFFRKLLDTALYNHHRKEYLAKVDLGHHSCRQPPPYQTGHIIADSDFDKTCQAVIDNIFDMQALCKARGIRFVLVTQKLFGPDNPYYRLLGPNTRVLQYYKTMDQFTEICNSRLITSERLRDADIIPAHTLMPNEWDEDSITKVRSFYSDRTIDTTMPLSYDAMHFTPGGCYLFSVIVGEKLLSFIP